MYQRGVRRDFRNHPAMIVDIPVTDHNQLHANVMPSETIPAKSLIVLALGRLASLDLETLRPTEVVDDLAELMSYEGAPEMADHLWQQCHYLNQAHYKPNG